MSRDLTAWLRDISYCPLRCLDRSGISKILAEILTRPKTTRPTQKTTALLIHKRRKAVSDVTTEHARITADGGR